MIPLSQDIYMQIFDQTTIYASLIVIFQWKE